MATIWSSMWDLLYTVVVVLMLLGGVAWVLQWRRGQRTILDERRRPKATAALALLLGALVVVGLVSAILTG
jgi:hypothetical protein